MGGAATVPGRGRKPKPTALKRLGGNAGKRALNKNEPTFTPLIGVACPEWLAEDQWAPTLWDMVIKPRFRSQFRNKLLHTEHQEA